MKSGAAGRCISLCKVLCTERRSLQATCDVAYIMQALTVTLLYIDTGQLTHCDVLLAQLAGWAPGSSWL